MGKSGRDEFEEKLRAAMANAIGGRGSQDERRGHGMLEAQNVSELRKAYGVFSKKHTFAPGDIVQWKPGMQNKATVGPFIVLQVLDEPVYGTTDESASPYFREPLDLICGIVDEEGCLICFYYDSRRFEPYKE